MSRFYDAVILILIVTATIISGQMLPFPAREAVLSLDLPQLYLPRAGFDVLEHFPDTARTFRWTQGSARLSLPHPGKTAILELQLAAGPGGTTPTSIQIGAHQATIAVMPGLRRYAFLLPSGQREQVRLAIDSPVVTAHHRSLGILVSDVSIAGGGSLPAMVTLGFVLAAISWYLLLRYARVDIQHAAGLIVLVLVLAHGWYIIDGWRYSIASVLALLLAGSGLVALLLEWEWFSETGTPSSIVRSAGVLLVAIVCVRFPGLLLPDPGPGTLLLGIAVASVGGYAVLRHYGLSLLLGALTIAVCAGLVLCWYAASGWVPSSIDSLLLFGGIAALLVVSLGRWRTPLLGYAAIPSIIGIILVSYAGQYFFLMDDFALLAGAQQHLQEIFGNGQIGFYRPVVFALLKMQFALFGWHTPSGYMLFSLVGHGLNALLVALLAHRELALERRYSLLAALLFLLSPWASEALFWMSCQFDIVATTGILVTLLLALRSTEQGDARWNDALRLALAGIVALLSLWSKESAVALPGLFACLTIARHGWKRSLANRRSWRTGLVLVAAVMIALGVRGSVLESAGGAFGGAYGNYFALFSSIKSLNVTDAILNPPAGLQPSSYDQLIHAAYAVTLFLLFAGAWILAFRRAALLTLAWMIAMLPVIWAGQLGGRLMYTPGVFIVLLLVTGLCVLEQRMAELCDRLPALPRTLGHEKEVLRFLAGYPRGGSWLYSQSRAVVLSCGIDALVLVACVYGLTGLNHQKLLWAQSNDLARQTLDVVAEYKDSDQQVRLRQLPFTVSGAYILKPYAFPFYYQRSMDIQADRGYLSYWRSSLLFEGKQVLAHARQKAAALVITLEVRDIK